MAASLYLYSCKSILFESLSSLSCCVSARASFLLDQNQALLISTISQSTIPSQVESYCPTSMSSSPISSLYSLHNRQAGYQAYSKTVLAATWLGPGYVVCALQPTVLACCSTTTSTTIYPVGSGEKSSTSNRPTQTFGAYRSYDPSKGPGITASAATKAARAGIPIVAVLVICFWAWLKYKQEIFSSCAAPR